MEWNHECVSKSKRKCWALESEFLEAWAILHKFLKQGCCRHLFLTHRLIQKKQRNNCEATQMMVRKVHVYFKIGSSISWHLPNVKNCHPPSLKPPMWSSGQLQVHCQPLCGAIIEVKIRSLSWIGVSTLVAADLLTILYRSVCFVS
jgi:hypothetical protein